MQDHLSLTFAALADPTRRAMLAQLSKGEASVSDLAKPFLNEMSLPAITKHIKVLERAGLVTKTKDAQWRPCKLKPDGLKEVADWMDEYRVFWEESFDRLEVYLAELQMQQAQPPAQIENQIESQIENLIEAKTKSSKKGRNNAGKK